LGAFIAGSITVFNLKMAQFQFDTAELIGVSKCRADCCPGVGCGCRHTIAIHPTVAASATVGLLVRQGQAIRMNIIPMIYYLIMAYLLILGGLWDGYPCPLDVSLG
jgi:lactate permease